MRELDGRYQRNYNPLAKPWKVRFFVWLRRSPAAPLLALFLVLDMAIFTYTHTAGASFNHGDGLYVQQVFWLAADGFLVWRVWVGAIWAWALLLVIIILPVAMTLLTLTATAYLVGLWILILGQLVILLTPAIRRRVFRRDQQD